MDEEQQHREMEMEEEEEVTRWSMQKFLLISTLAPHAFFFSFIHKIKCLD